MTDNCTHDCSSCGENCEDRETSSTPKSFLKQPLESTHIKKIIGVVSGKGGVGKSLVTSLLAAESRKRGYETAILDADITGPSIPKAFGLKTKALGNGKVIYPVCTKTGIEVMSLNLLTENDTDPVVWRGPVIAGAVTQFWTEVEWGDVDYMFIDMPPGTGDVPLTVFQSIPVDGIVIVTSPQELVEMIVEKAVRMAEMMKIPVLALVENMSYALCPHCGEKIEIFGESHGAATADKFKIDTMVKLPIDNTLTKACDDGRIEFADSGYVGEIMDLLESK